MKLALMETILFRASFLTIYVLTDFDKLIFCLFIYVKLIHLFGFDKLNNKTIQTQQDTVQKPF